MRNSTLDADGVNDEDPITDDPLFKHDQWLKIRSTIMSHCNGAKFCQIEDALKVIIGNYRAAAINERPEMLNKPEQDIYFNFRSAENRKRLKRAIKVLAEIKKIFMHQSTVDGRTEGKLREEAQILLTHNTMRMCMRDRDELVNIKINGIAHWLQKNTANICVEHFNQTIDLAITIYREQFMETTKLGASAKIARDRAIMELRKLWTNVTGLPATVSTKNTVISGRFYNFVEAVLVPVGEQLGDKSNVCALPSAVKSLIYSKKDKSQKY